MTTIWEQQQHIYQDALPVREGLADIFSIALTRGKADESIMDPLLAGQRFTLLLQQNANAHIPLMHWYQECRVQDRIFGHQPLGLGFPLFVFSEEEDLFVAPMYIWPLELNPHLQTPGVWQLTDDANREVVCNEWLLDRLRGRLTAEELQALQAPPSVGLDALSARLNDIAERLGWAPVEQGATIEACPTLEELGQGAEPSRILLSAVIGPFPLQDLPPPPDREEVWENGAGPAGGHAFGYGNLDPHQAAAFHHMRSGDPVLISGAAGTGKTQLVNHLLSNALSNGQRCLVLSPTSGDLEEIKRELARLGLESLCLTATGRVGEEVDLVNTIRQVTDQDALPGGHDEGAFQQLLGKWQREIQKLDDRYTALRQPVFGTHDWAETVGLFLGSNRREGKELLSANLNRQDFQFTHREFEDLKAAVAESRPLYQQLNTLHHPLNNVHPDVFLDREEADAAAFLKEQLNVFLRKCQDLHKRYISKSDEYAGALQAFYDEWYKELARRADGLIERTEDDAIRFGRDYELTSLLSLRLYGALFGRFRRMRQAKEAAFADYRALVARFQVAPQFDFDFAAANEGRQLPRMRESLTAFRDRLASWRDRLPTMVREELVRLSNKTVHPQLHFEGHVRELEEALDLQLAEINQAGLYADPLESRMLTLQKRRKYLEGVIEQLENTRLALRDFDRFYPWRRHWLQLTEPARKLVQALVKVKPADWTTAFESWYLNECLIKAYSPDLPGGSFSLRQYVYNHDQLLDRLLPQIGQYWKDSRRNLLRHLRREDRPRYQLFSGKKTADEALLDLLHSDPGLIARLIPVWLMTPQAAARMALPTHTFDFVLVEQAQSLSFNQAAAGLAAGSRRIFLGDPQQVLLGPERSLMIEAERSAARYCQLPVVHGNKPADALRQVQSARPPAAGAAPAQVRIEAVEGRFDERDQTNEAEAREAIRLLKAVERLPDGRYPSVAIVAFTKGQRDLIASRLLEVRQRGMAGIDKLDALTAAGFGIFTMEEMLGRHPEVLIVSATYGPLDRQGGLTDRIHQLDRVEGQALLSLLISRPSHSLYMLHSLPTAALKNFSDDYKSRGTFLLVNYFNYISALQDADVERQQFIVQKLSNYFPGKQAPDRAPSPFLQEVAIALQSYFPSGRIHLGVSDAQTHLPLKIDPPQGEDNPVVLLPDGFFGRTARTDYRWEFGQWEYFADQHYTVLPIWSVNWWKSAQQESRKLASTIMEEMERSSEPAED